MAPEIAWCCPDFSISHSSGTSSKHLVDHSCKFLFLAMALSIFFKQRFLPRYLPINFAPHWYICFDKKTSSFDKPLSFPVSKKTRWAPNIPQLFQPENNDNCPPVALVMELNQIQRNHLFFCENSNPSSYSLILMHALMDNSLVAIDNFW